MDCSQMASHEEDEASNYEGDESPSGHNETMPSKGKRKRWGDYVIPKKHGKEVEEDTVPYASDSVDDAMMLIEIETSETGIQTQSLDALTRTRHQ